MLKQSKMYHERFLPMLQISQTTLAKLAQIQPLLNSQIPKNNARPRAWDVAVSDSTSQKCSNSAFPTSKHQKTSDLEVSDDLENLSVPTLWRISKFEEVLTQHKGELMPISRLCSKF